MKIINPSNGNLIKEIYSDSIESVKTKFTDAQRYFDFYSRSDIEFRKKAIQKFSQKLLSHVDELALIQSIETGKVFGHAKNEILAVRKRIDYFLEHTEPLMKTTHEYSDENIQESIEWEPLGVVLNISAWNYPWFVGLNVIVPALLTGNTVLYKPSEYATLTGLEIQTLLYAAGIPKHAFQVVIGNGSIGKALTDLPIDAVFFTGSYETGIKIASAVAKKLIPVQMELGGKDPSYICDDVDILKTAASVADGAFFNAGQSCCSVERIYIHSAIYDQFVAEFTKIVQDFVVGDPSEENSFIGPMINAQALKKVNSHVQDALSKNAKLLTGGKVMERPGHFFEPTVLADTNHSMIMMKDESFGPIAGLQKVSCDDEAIKLMNDTEYGLTAGVFTKDESRARNILSKVKSGTAYWNCSDRVSPWVPWTSRRHSGIGSTLSRAGIRAFLQPRSWHMKKP